MKRSRILEWAAGWICLLAGCGLAAEPVAEQPRLIVTSPVERHVFQRQTAETGVIHIVLQGAPDGANTIIEARLTRVEKSRRGKDVDWTRLSLIPGKTAKNPVATGTADLMAPAGGWYRLDIRAREGEKGIAEVSIAKVGIGEVFVTAGQSNSSNWGEGTSEAKDDRVVYCDGKNFVPARDPLPNSYGQERTKNHGNQYPALGDRLAAAWDVPVAFRSATMQATQVSEWMPNGATGQYRYLVDRVAAFGPRGVRAVLWHQGEYDAIHGVPDEIYRDILSHVIRRMRKDVGYETDWFVAEAYKPKAQRMIWESKVCFPGPLSDDLKGKEFRYDGIHFSTAGLEVLAKRWFDVLNKQYGEGEAVKPPK